MTSDQLEEFIVQADEDAVFAYLAIFPPQNKKDYLATAIVSQSTPMIVKFLCAGVCIDPRDDDILYLCAKHQNSLAFAVIAGFAILRPETRELIGKVIDVGSVHPDELDKWDKLDHTNPRNLMYAIAAQDIPRIFELLKRGSDVTYWESYCLRYALIRYKVEKREEFFDVVKALMKHGAKMGAVIKDKKFLDKISPKVDRWLASGAGIEVTLE
jgi:hypothetical protein